jgi:hypothetical protein
LPYLDLDRQPERFACGLRHRVFHPASVVGRAGLSRSTRFLFTMSETTRAPPVECRRGNTRGGVDAIDCSREHIHTDVITQAQHQ